MFNFLKKSKGFPLKEGPLSELQIHQKAFHEFKFQAEKYNYNFDKLLTIYPYKILQLKQVLIGNVDQDEAGLVHTIKGFLLKDTENYISIEDLQQIDPENVNTTEAICTTVRKDQVLLVFECYNPITAMLNNKENQELLKDISVDSKGDLFNIKTGQTVQIKKEEE